jgi:hypothetical protein
LLTIFKEKVPPYKDEKMKGSLMFMIVALALKVEHGVSMTASPFPFDEIQPDGSVVTLLLHGDEYSHDASDLQGAFRDSQRTNNCPSSPQTGSTANSIWTHLSKMT